MFLSLVCKAPSAKPDVLEPGFTTKHLWPTSRHKSMQPVSKMWWKIFPVDSVHICGQAVCKRIGIRFFFPLAYSLLCFAR